MNIQRFDFSVDVLKVIPWMSDQSPNLRALLEQYQVWYTENHSQFWVDWERDVFNLLTANDFGLNVWSIILDLPLFITVDASPADYPAWGFGPFGMNFENGNFARDDAGTQSLTTEQKRQLLRLRMWQLTSSGTMPDINKALRDVFGAGAYALDGKDMTITYIFLGVLPKAMLSLIQRYDIVPRPSGVKARFIIKPRIGFGFGPDDTNFNQQFSQFVG